MSSLPSDAKDHPKTTGPLNWFNDLNVTSISFSPSTLQNATDAVFPSSVEVSPELQFFYSLDTGSTSRFRMVGGPVVKVQQLTYNAQASRSIPRVRCLKGKDGGHFAEPHRKGLGGCGASRINKLTLSSR